MYLPTMARVRAMKYQGSEKNFDLAGGNIKILIIWSVTFVYVEQGECM